MRRSRSSDGTLRAGFLGGSTGLSFRRVGPDFIGARFTARALGGAAVRTEPVLAPAFLAVTFLAGAFLAVAFPTTGRAAVARVAGWPAVFMARVAAGLAVAAARVDLALPFDGSSFVPALVVARGLAAVLAVALRLALLLEPDVALAAVFALAGVLALAWDLAAALAVPAGLAPLFTRGLAAADLLGVAAFAEVFRVALRFAAVLFAMSRPLGIP